LSTLGVKLDWPLVAQPGASRFSASSKMVATTVLANRYTDFDMMHLSVVVETQGNGGTRNMK